MFKKTWGNFNEKNDFDIIFALVCYRKVIILNI